MSDLLEFVTEEHGGLELWSHASSVTATVDFYGGFFDDRGQGDLLGPCEVSAALDRQYVSVRSAKSGHTIFFDGAQDRVIVTAKSGQVVEDLEHARQSMLALAPLGPTTPWTAAQTGHFIGYALWSYLLEPYVFHWPDSRRFSSTCTRLPSTRDDSSEQIRFPVRHRRPSTPALPAYPK